MALRAASQFRKQRVTAANPEDKAATMSIVGLSRCRADDVVSTPGIGFPEDTHRLGVRAIRADLALDGVYLLALSSHHEIHFSPGLVPPEVKVLPASAHAQGI